MRTEHEKEIDMLCNHSVMCLFMDVLKEVSGR